MTPPSSQAEASVAPAHRGFRDTASRPIASSAALVRAAEHRVALALPRRIDDFALAAMLGLPIDTIRAAFAHVHGETIYRSLLKLRVKLVERALEADPGLCPRAVAQSCGFGSLGRFYQIYQRDTGRSLGPALTRDSFDPLSLNKARAAVMAAVERHFESGRP